MFAMIFHLQLIFLLAAIFTLSDANEHNELKGQNVGNGSDEALSPIILIPGSMASKVYLQHAQFPAKNPCAKHYDTQKSTPKIGKNFQLWYSLDLMDAEKRACIFYMLSLRPKATGHSGKFVNKSSSVCFVNQPSIRLDNLGTAKFGDILPVQCLFSGETPACQDSIKNKQTEAAFGPFAQWLHEKLGYNKNGSNNLLYAAPYDWRHSPDSVNLIGYYKALKKLIEDAFHRSGKKVYLVQHSMGNMIGNWFLTSGKHGIDEHWQKKYLAGTINVGAPFGGTVEILEELLTGASFRYFDSLSSIISNREVLPFARSLGSNPIFVPNNLAEWPTTEPMVTLNGVEYGIKDMGKLLAAIEGSPHLEQIYQTYQHQIKQQFHTPMFCVYGTEVDTPIGYNYGATYINLADPYKMTEKTKEKATNGTKVVKEEGKEEGNEDKQTNATLVPEAIMGKGDGTINLESLNVCHKWTKNVLELGAVDHAQAIMHDKFYEYVRQILTGHIGKE